MLISLLLTTSHAFADFEYFESNGIRYELITSQKPNFVKVVSKTDGYLGSITIPETVKYNRYTYSVKTIANGAFSKCTGLTSISLSNSVLYIGMGAFSGCTELSNVKLGDNTISIESGAFSDCIKLKSINLSDSIIYIKTGAFANSGLTKIVLPKNLLTIPKGLCKDCTNLTEITIPENIQEIGDEAFLNTAWYNNQPDGVIYLDNCCIGYKKTRPTGKLVINEDTRCIAAYAFRNCWITEVVLGEKLTAIGESAFASTWLSDIKIPSSVKYLGSNIFDKSALRNIVILENIKKIPSYTFNSCTLLTQITLPNSITDIQGYAFYGCSNLKLINSMNPNPPTCGKDAFKNTNVTECVLKVPSESVELYKNADTWKDFMIQGVDFSGIENNLIDNNKEAEYYNLQGVRVLNPERGVYIKREGGKVSKVIVR